MVKLVVYKNRCSVASLSTEFQSASESDISTNTVCQELHEMGFHCRAASDKITMCNAKLQLEWKQLKRILWCDESLNSLSGSMMVNLGLMDPRGTLPSRTHSIGNKVW